jgi:hypothetical protein
MVRVRCYGGGWCGAMRYNIIEIVGWDVEKGSVVLESGRKGT